jgi:hypothetical protein
MHIIEICEVLEPVNPPIESMRQRYVIKASPKTVAAGTIGSWAIKGSSIAVNPPARK